MARPSRADVFSPDEIAIVHAMNRVVRRCFLLGSDPLTGKNYDHRKRWIEEQFQRLAAYFGIDLLCFSILSNHFHLVLRSRPDVVATWDDTEVARRWLMLCPVRKREDGSAEEPSVVELNSVRNDSKAGAEIRRRLSDVSWWMRLLCQHVAQRANREDHETGRFWQDRFKAVRLLDEESLLACAAYVDLNPIRAAMAETLETSDFTSAQRRVEALASASCLPDVTGAAGASAPADAPQKRALSADYFLSPLQIDERVDPLGPAPHTDGRRCSDRGFLAISTAEYLELLDWTARQRGRGKRVRPLTTCPPSLSGYRFSATCGANW